MRKWNRKMTVGTVILLLICTLFPMVSHFTSDAALVDVYTNENPELEFINIYGDQCMGYAPSTTLSKMNRQEQGVYKMQSNSWAMWSVHDSISYAYTKSAFNTGKDTVMTIQFSINESNATEIGLAVRKSLDPGSECFLGSLRESEAYFLVRQQRDAGYAYNKITANTVFGGSEPMHVKVVLNKGKSRVTTYYKKGGLIDDESGWNTIGTKTISFIGDCLELYTGITISSGEESKTVNATCSNFSVRVQAPEGYVIEDGTGDTEGGNEDNKEDEIKLPDDLAAAGDALLYETFTDGELFPKEPALTNPSWSVRAGTPTVEVDSDKINRYLNVISNDEELLMTAGDMEWTDYTAQMDFMFTEDTVPGDINQISLLFRHVSAVIGGSADYMVTLINKFDGDGNFSGQYLQICYRGCQMTFIPSNPTVRAEVCVSETEMLEKNTRHTLKVSALDNVFDVYLDDMTTPVLTYTDTNPGTSVTNDAHLKGCIGIWTQAATVQIDNIVVRKLNDPLGGDYDNDIMGNYDQPIPDWIAERYYKD